MGIHINCTVNCTDNQLYFIVQLYGKYKKLKKYTMSYGWLKHFRAEHLHSGMEVGNITQLKIFIQSIVNVTYD